MVYDVANHTDVSDDVWSDIVVDSLHANMAQCWSGILVTWYDDVVVVFADASDMVRWSLMAWHSDDMALCDSTTVVRGSLDYLHGPDHVRPDQFGKK